MNSDKVINILKREGPMLSGELAHLIEKEYGMTNASARQVLSRTGGAVKKISNIGFDKNQKFFYLEKQYGTKKYANNLIDAISKGSQIYRIYINAFWSQNGYVSKDMLPSLVASPVKNIKGHKRYDRILKDLCDLHIIGEYDEFTWELNSWIMQEYSVNYNRALGIEVVKKQIARDFLSWAARINLSGFNSGKIFGESEFGGFRWAYTAPSYIQPIYSSKRKVPGFIVADVFFGHVAEIENIDFFLKKINILRAFKNLPPFLPVLIVDKVSEDALKRLKESGIMIAILKNLFDENYSKRLEEIVEVFTNASAIIMRNHEKMTKLFEEISKWEGRYNDIVGDMFELMVGYYYHMVGGNNIIIKKSIGFTYKNDKNEIDVMFNKDGKKYIIECKASRKPLDKKYVDIWLGKNIPNIREWLINRADEPQDHVFQLWSLGGFNEEAKELLEERSQKTSKYKIEFFDSEEIIKKVRGDKVNLIADMIEQHIKKTSISKTIK